MGLNVYGVLFAAATADWEARTWKRSVGKRMWIENRAGRPPDGWCGTLRAGCRGDAYFPQILKYTENAPQESILSRDNYSTSNHPSTM